MAGSTKMGLKMSRRTKQNLKKLIYAGIVTLILAGCVKETKGSDSNSIPRCGDPNHPYPIGDLNQDCRVDFLDLAILASHWLEDHTPIGTVTTTYQFLPDQSTMVWHVGRAGWSIPHSIEGQFQLVVDFDEGIARFKQADAILTNGQAPPTHPDVNLNGKSLGDLFLMCQLVGTIVSDTAVHFEGHFDSGSPSDRLVVIELTLIDNLVHLVGSEEYAEVIADRDAYSLDAIAVMLTDP
jgi:hypothetical protein